MFKNVSSVQSTDDGAGDIQGALGIGRVAKGVHGSEPQVRSMLAGAWGSASPLTCCGIMGELLNLSVSLFPLDKEGDDN